MSEKKGRLTMKKRFVSAVLIFCMLAGCAVSTAAAFDSGRNVYGHTITYAPVTELYTGGERVKFFNSAISEWANLSDKITQNEANSIKWLQENSYLLNHFGRYFSGADMPSCYNSKGEWLSQLRGPRNVRRWYANVSFDALNDKAQRQNGNIDNMYNKGDLQYFLSWKVKTVQTKWGLTGKSNDTGDTFVFGENTHSSGGGWKKYNTVGDGPNLGYSSAWKSAKDFNLISFDAKSDKDAQVDSYLSGAMLVGKDIKGPKIDSVRVTSDIDGKNELKNGTVTLDTLETLKDRTVYFQVQWDEPVVFKNLSQKEIENLTLSVETIGIDGTSGMIAEAPFIKFAPSKTDAKPVMVFEYKIADPYADSSSVTMERGYFYKFSNVTISERDNVKLWNNIYDISGNKFAADENGLQPSGRVVSIVRGVPKVDLLPFGIKSISVKKSGDENSVYIGKYEKLDITVKLNKNLPANTYIKNLPEITLNVKDSSGNYVTAKPNNVSPDTITYSLKFYNGYKMDGNSVLVTKFLSGGNVVRDDSGYTLMNYEINDDGMLSPTDIPKIAQGSKDKYSVSPDRQYKLDFDAPETDITASDLGNGIVMLKASVYDISLDGCEASFTVKVNGRSEGEGMSYQVSSSESCDDLQWKKAEDGAMSVSFSSPVVTGIGGKNAYGFIKLAQNSEADKIEVSVCVADEAGNTSNKTFNLSSPGWAGFDTLAPTVKASVNGENIDVTVSDADDDVTYMYGFSEDEFTEPETYASQSGKSGVISAPSLPSESMIYERYVWIKAKDSKNNTSGALKVLMKYDRSYTSVRYSAATDKMYCSGDYPFAEFHIENAKSYWYMWAEKPANTIDCAAYISDNFVSVLKSYAQNLTQDSSIGLEFTKELADDEPDTPQSNNKNDFLIQLPDAAVVAGINPEDESYYGLIAPSDTSRPIILVIGAERDDGETLVRTAEFNTVYGAPKINVIQSRFSSNDKNGRRVDYIRNGENKGVIQASDGYDYPVNTPNLYGFAQGEICLEGDPVTGFDRVDTENSSIVLEKVVHKDWYSMENAERTVINEWKLGDIGLCNLPDGKKSVIVDIDPENLGTTYLEYDENNERCAVEYAIVCNLSYSGTIPQEKRDIAYFAFNNTPMAFMEGTYYDDGWMSMYHNFEYYEEKNTEAVFDTDGNDITPDIPVYTIGTDYAERHNYKQYIRFAAPGYRFANMYYCAPAYNSSDESKLKVHIGTDANNLSEVLSFDGSASEYYDIGRYIFGEEGKFCEQKLYYMFEHPDKGTFSPLYVMKIRRDNQPPVFDISVSETESSAKEVLVTVSLYDTQLSADGKTEVIDTPESVMRSIEWFMLEAWRAPTEDDEPIACDAGDSYGGYEDETGEILPPSQRITVYPDENGVYHFISNGAVTMLAVDRAGNTNRGAIINGKMYDDLMAGDYPVYYIDNVDNIPPSFIKEPVFSVNNEEGSFSVSATADETVKNVYLKFDKNYTALLSDGNPEENIRYGIKNVPGMISGGFDKESGEIDAKVYVKYSESTPLASATLVIEDNAGNETEYKFDTSSSPLYGKKAEISDDKYQKNANGYPILTYGDTLDFTVPVRIDGFGEEYSVSYENIPIYSDGIMQIEFTDLFGESYVNSIYADIYGAAFAHSLIFTANGGEISPQTPVSAPVTVTIDTSKTEGLSVEGGEQKLEFLQNGTKKYTLTNSGLSQDGMTREFTVSVTNIDTTVPEAIVSFVTESETDPETGKIKIYSATYAVEGFDEDGVTMDEGSASSVTFDYTSEQKVYTFKFGDAAGNKGTYTADASDIEFSKREDNKITDYRLTYFAADKNGFKNIGQFKSGEKCDGIGLVNSAVSVKIEALNKNGETVPAAIKANGSLPDGVRILPEEKLAVFETESSNDRTVNLTLTGEGSANTINASVTLFADTIDITPPTGTVCYKADGNTVKAYLVTNDTDLAENGISVSGTKSDKTEFELKQDEGGYYTEFDENGYGKFILTDKAGNTGTVLIAVLTIDKEPPRAVYEGWQSVFDALTKEKIDELLATPTNSTIKLFITFNEQLSGADVKAYKDSNKNEELTPTDDYVTALIGGSTLTVEFKQNCAANITVYDLRGNKTELWRPEYGPITVIDRDVPKMETGYPTMPYYSEEDNTVTVKYVFAGNEEVMLLQNESGGYKNEHTVIFKENGTKILNFADRAGNVYSDYPVITQIVESAPGIIMKADYFGEGKELSGNDSYMAGNFYTNKNVRILLNIDDKTLGKNMPSAKTKSGTSIKVNKENITLPDGKSYNYNFTITENGSYFVTVKDKWGHENTVETNISVIDRTAPAIRLSSPSFAAKIGMSADEVKEGILKCVTATDLQSGANSPMGDKADMLKNVTEGVVLNVDLKDVNLEKAGLYTAKITASDRLGNTSEKDFAVTVAKDVYTFNINGVNVYANDIFTAEKGKITLYDSSEDTKFYYDAGYKTAAQLKYAKSFEPDKGFDAQKKGYYTILAQKEGRKMYIVYVYVY